MTMGLTRCVALDGIAGAVVDVEADIVKGLPAFAISGLPDAACRQSADRVKAAAANLGRSLAQDRITVNLSPAWLPKVGSTFDLGIAVAVLAATGALQQRYIADVVHIGEVGLDGTIRPVRGVLPLVLAAVQAGHREVVVPAANAAEAALVSGARVVPVTTLAEVIARYEALADGRPVAEVSVPAGEASRPGPMRDLGEIAGQTEARFALEVAAAGGHHLFLLGPPGAGKTMLAECMPGVLPRLGEQDAMQVTAIHSLLGQLEDGSMMRRAPFVAPHHDASLAALVGGGSAAVRPGLISQAHAGVLFLDEAPEFRRTVLQALRQPLESGQVVVARARRSVRYPARFQLVLAANPCPCGAAVGKGLACRCRAQQRREYLTRLGGPLLDRVDLRVTVDAVRLADLALPRGDSSAVVADRVAAARRAQALRWGESTWQLNSQVPGPYLRNGPLPVARGATVDLDRELDHGLMTLRGYDRVLRVAWTVHDLRGGDGGPTRDDIGAALLLRGQEVSAA